MPENPKIKVSAIIADLTTYLTECKKFEEANTIIEKHVSSQIIQIPNPNFTKNNGRIHIPGIPQVTTTVMISVLYVHEVKETVLKTN